MALPTFPIIVLDGKTPIPPNTICYIVAKNGTFMQQVTPYCTRIIPVEGISSLQVIQPSVASRLPLIPALVLAKARMFFRKVFYKYHAESALMMYINDITGTWELDCPAQEVSYSGVEYKNGLSMLSSTGRRLQGTIHSHCDFGAGHSGTDTHDEIDFNGLHLTMGHVNQDNFSLVSSFSFHKSRFQVEPETVVAGLVNHGSQYHHSVHSGFRSEAQYSISLTDEEVEITLNQILDDIDDEWMPLVAPRVQYSFAPYYSGKRNKRRKQKSLTTWQGPTTPALIVQANEEINVELTQDEPTYEIPIVEGIPVDEPARSPDVDPDKAWSDLKKELEVELGKKSQN
jgi:hypothetical protein